MHLWRNLLVIGVLLALPTLSRAGLHYSGEPMAELPSQWRGFLLDQKTLRTIAIKPSAGAPANSFRLLYLDAAAKLEKVAKERKLSADEKADLGAVLVRLGEIPKAITLLRTAHLEHPNHFAIAANLGTAWQLAGELDQAALCLQEAVRLAPGKLQQAEEYHLKLVRFRKQKKGGLDDLFGIRYVGDDGKYEPGKLAAAERKKLPEGAVAIVQQLALWLPADGPLLWQLAELANIHDDFKVAAAMMDGCITQFGIQSPELRLNRQMTRLASEDQAKTAAKAEHGGEHVSLLKARSKRPLLIKLDTTLLPPISATAVNAMPWALLGETNVGKDFRPTFAKYLKELDGKLVSLTGYMQPLSEELEVAVFMFIEYPVGCWYCEMPEVTQIVFVELPANKTAAYTRSMVRITGRLVLNSTDPEEFLYTIRNAKVNDVD
jgi:tetratricopeptide (TPR) repeat protein